MHSELAATSLLPMRHETPACRVLAVNQALRWLISSTDRADSKGSNVSPRVDDSRVRRVVHSSVLGLALRHSATEVLTCHTETTTG